MYINEFYKNKKQNIHIIILFLIIIIVICFWPNYFSKDGFTTTVPATTKPKNRQKVIYSLPSTTMIANIPETSRVYSSFFNDGKGTTLNKSTLDSLTCWTPSLGNNNTNQFVTLNLTTPKKVYGIAIKGRADFIFDYVKTFKVNYTTSTSSAFLPIDNSTIFNSNLYIYTDVNGKEISYILFTNPVIANTISINPQTWNKSIGMRVDLLIDFVPQTTVYEYLPVINGAIRQPVAIPTIPVITNYISDNNDIINSLNSTYDFIKNERNTNLDNQDRINKLEERIKKIKLDIISITNSSTNNKIKEPSFY